MSDTEQIVAYFVRHGTTDLNQEGRFRGPVDVELDDKGREDAQKLGAYFSDKDLGQAWSSDRKRALTTANAMFQLKGMTYTPEESLRAWNVGYLAGEKKSEHQDEINYFQGNPDVQIPNGESLQDFRDRVTEPILRAIHTGIRTGKPSVVVAHSSTIHELGNIIHNDHNAANVRPGGVVGVTMQDGNLKATPLVRATSKDKNYSS